MIVVDASAAVSALLNAGPARDLLAVEQLHAPHLVDAEVASVFRRRVARGLMRASDGWVALDTFARLGISRHPIHPLLDRIWALRDNLSAYDASYVALAEALDCPLLTADARVGGAPGLRCAVTLVPAL
jgi:predicted nucleic acid-binding protein